MRHALSARLLAAIGMTVLGPVQRGGRWIFIGIGIYGLATIFFAESRIFWFSVLMLMFTGMGDTISSILRSTINQLSTPDELRGRMSSINSIFTSNGPQLGQFESGLVAAWLGAQASALTGGAATLIILAVVAVAFPMVRHCQIQHAKSGVHPCCLTTIRVGLF